MSKRGEHMRFPKFDIWDIGLIKWSCMFFALCVVSVWPAFAGWVVQTHWSIFLLASLLLAIRPTVTMFQKK